MFLGALQGSWPQGQGCAWQSQTRGCSPSWASRTEAATRFGVGVREGHGKGIEADAEPGCSAPLTQVGTGQGLPSQSGPRVKAQGFDQAGGWAETPGGSCLTRAGAMDELPLGSDSLSQFWPQLSEPEQGSSLL